MDKSRYKCQGKKSHRQIFHCLFQTLVAVATRLFPLPPSQTTEHHCQPYCFWNKHGSIHYVEQEPIILFCSKKSHTYSGVFVLFLLLGVFLVCLFHTQAMQIKTSSSSSPCYILQNTNKTVYISIEEQNNK